MSVSLAVISSEPGSSEHTREFSTKYEHLRALLHLPLLQHLHSLSLQLFEGGTEPPALATGGSKGSRAVDSQVCRQELPGQGRGM